MAALPTQSSQQKNFKILNRIRHGEFVTKVAPPAATLIEGEWLIVDPETEAWARALNAFHGAAIGACFPVIGKPSEHMNKALRSTARGPQGMVPVYIGALPYLVETKVYDSDADFSTVGTIVDIGTITVDEVSYAGFIANGAGIPAGRILATPESNGGWLRVLVTFA